jgi:hypothetical protein
MDLNRVKNVRMRNEMREGHGIDISKYCVEPGLYDITDVYSPGYEKELVFLDATLEKYVVCIAKKLGTKRILASLDSRFRGHPWMDLIWYKY